jgi:hypothetical protein
VSAWRRQALIELPELRVCIEQARTPMALWIELKLAFDEAVRRKDASSIRRTLRFADWCCSDRSGRLPNDASTAAVCAFYEHLPDDRTCWHRFSEWFFPHEFERLLPIFAFHLSAPDLEILKSAYAQGRDQLV